MISGYELSPLIAKANTELNKIANWIHANKMAVNVSKTKYIIFKSKGKKITLANGEGIVFDESEIGHTKDQNSITKLERICNDNPNPNNRTYKLLGVYLDEHLSFDSHCDHVCAKVSQANYLLNRTKNFLPIKHLKTLYYALVHPYLLYCLPIYGCTSKKT